MSNSPPEIDFRRAAPKEANHHIAYEVVLSQNGYGSPQDSTLLRGKEPAPVTLGQPNQTHDNRCNAYGFMSDGVTSDSPLTCRCRQR